MDGTINPMIIWSECGYSISGVHSVLQQPDGSYLIRSTVSNMTMRRANPSELKARTRLTVGVLGDAQAFARTVFSFNAESEDCYVQIVDLTDDGSLSEDQALLRLNTQILSGEGPDMLLFRGSFTPFPYIHRGLLREMSGDIENDPDITLEDIIPAKAIRNDFGGIYLLGGGLDMETRVGLQSRFGFCWGWSFDRYREIDQSMPQGTMVMYNLDKEYFFRKAMSRYIRSAVDWQNSSCDFDNESFIRVLEACRTVHETPEDPNNPGNPDPENPAELFPITFDAIVIDAVEENQETITEVTTPSITTYSATSDVTSNNEYKVGEEIIITAEDGVIPTAWDYILSAEEITEAKAASKYATATWISLGTSLKATLTPTEEGYYIIRLTTGSGTAYKVIKVIS